MTSAMRSPISGSAALTVRDLGDLVVALDRRRRALRMASATVSAALSMPIFICIGFAPAATFLQALGDDRLGQHGRGRGAVAGHVLGLGRGLLEELRAHVLERIVELDVPGDRHAVVGDRRGAVLLVQGDVAALGPERRLDGIRQRVHAALHRVRRASSS